MLPGIDLCWMACGWWAVTHLASWCVASRPKGGGGRWKKVAAQGEEGHGGRGEVCGGKGRA